ncbi:GGDEF domain-containing protein [Arsenicicoccus sp. oral taxon 190]|uniref:GGDEF domain-containing protein n=1 Tax=Arsenicicoccus sp. oral taxon 190 TaxID=1658671 RepID=UPI00067A42B3|nr:GGDEF domain-containing protein [Arsenicicoccus sp. oral taxon 190]AKT51240.1 hypothetical protein ADJ73_07805 [Arsenicicoccus sp. oral taxon 190]
MDLAAWSGAAAPVRWQHLPEARLMLASAPAGALGVGVFDLLGSSGFASPAMALGFALVAVFYLVQLVLTLRRPEWTDTWWTVAVATASTLSSPLFTQFLVDPRPTVVWFWLIGCVLILAAYLCTPWRALVVGALSSGVGLLFAALSGLDLGDHAWALALGTVVNAVPGVAAALGLGRIRRRERHVLQQTRLDPLTGVLNRRGLEHALAEWSLGRPDRTVTLLSIHLDGFEEASTAWGPGPTDQVLTRVGVALTRAYHRSHLVARFVDHEFVVVSDSTPDLLVPAVLRAVRVASPQRPVTASAGVVSDIPLELLVSGQLVPILERARQLLARAQVARDGSARESLDAYGYTRIGVPTPVAMTQHASLEDRRISWPEAESRLLGWWLAATGVLLSLLPHSKGWPPLFTVLAYLCCLVLATGGVWLAHVPRAPLPAVHGLVLLTVPTTAGLVAGAQTAELRYLVLQLVAFPVLMAGMILTRRWVALLVALLPVGMVAATSLGDAPSPYAIGISVAGVVFPAEAALLASYIRQRSVRALGHLHALTLSDPTTGVLTRVGLARDFLDLPTSERAGVLLVSVLPRGADGRATSFESDLVHVATSLHAIGRGRGIVGRVGGRELALVVPSAERLALLRRRLDSDLAESAAHVRVLVGLAHTHQHTEAGLWEALAEADAAIRQQGGQGTGQPGGGRIVPATPDQGEATARQDLPAASSAESLA